MALKRSRARFIAALAVVALGSVAFGWASNSASGIASSVTISYSKGKFSGIVSAAGPCAANRTVTVNKAGRATPIGTDQTDANGAWEIAKRRARGTFTATVAASTVQGTAAGYGYNQDPTVTCDAATSSALERKRKKRGGGGGGGGGGGRPGQPFGPRDFAKLFARLAKLFPDFSFPVPRF